MKARFYGLLANPNPAAADPAAGWRAAALGGVEIVEVPGDHRTMVAAENAPALAAALDAVLDEREATRPRALAR